MRQGPDLIFDSDGSFMEEGMKETMFVTFAVRYEMACNSLHVVVGVLPAEERYLHLEAEVVICGGYTIIDDQEMEAVGMKKYAFRALSESLPT